MGEVLLIASCVRNLLHQRTGREDARDGHLPGWLRPPPLLHKTVGDQHLGHVITRGYGPVI